MRSRRSLVKIDRHVIYKVFPIKKHKRKRCTSPKVTVLVVVLQFEQLKSTQLYQGACLLISQLYSNAGLLD